MGHRPEEIDDAASARGMMQGGRQGAVREGRTEGGEQGAARRVPGGGQRTTGAWNSALDSEHLARDTGHWTPPDADATAMAPSFVVIGRTIFPIRRRQVPKRAKAGQTSHNSSPQADAILASTMHHSLRSIRYTSLTANARSLHYFRYLPYFRYFRYFRHFRMRRSHPGLTPLACPSPFTPCTSLDPRPSPTPLIHSLH
jgi:hypothetical protein